MKPLYIRAASLAAVILMFITGLSAQERDRTSTPDEYKWNLADLYPSVAAWKESEQHVSDALPELDRYRGTLGSSAGQLLGCLTLKSDLTREFDRLYAYATMSYDQDTRVQANLAMIQDLDILYAAFLSRMSFVEPEILKIDNNKIEQFISEEMKLAVYRHYLDDLMRRRSHTGTEGEEKILAETYLLAGAGYSVYDILSNSEFPYPEVTLSDGDTVEIDRAAYALYRASSDRGDRARVMKAFFGKLGEFRGTYGAQLNASVNQDIFYTKARKYRSSLESALDADNIPTAVYHNLVANANSNLAIFHRYLNLRKRLMFIEVLHYHDIYGPVFPGMSSRYDYKEAGRIIVAALHPLGDEYVSAVRRALDERWIDVYPSEGKSSGGYTNSTYDVHPYILLNYNGMLEDMRILIHEMGHAIHSHFSNTRQPFSTSRYSIFTAEVASTVNENLLSEYMLRNAETDSMRLSILLGTLQNMGGSFFRQTQFAEFELHIHEMAERGESLTGEVLDSVYYDIVKKYYGHDKGICLVDDEVKSEWIYVPHFYSSFYVYKYATSFVAAAAIAEKLCKEDSAARKQYFDFLSAGGSDYPIQLLTNAGVNLTTGEPFVITMNKMNRTMDEIETLLARMGR